jgi:hypothetical protein
LTIKTGFCKNGRFSFKKVSKMPKKLDPFANFDFDAAISEAQANRERYEASKPRAIRAVVEGEWLVLETNRGETKQIALATIQGVAQANPDDAAAVVIDPQGDVTWPQLDQHFLTEGLLAGITGTPSWMARLMGQRGGASTSEAKQAAVRQNGKRGGRPRKDGQPRANLALPLAIPNNADPFPPNLEASMRALAHQAGLSLEALWHQVLADHQVMEQKRKFSSETASPRYEGATNILKLTPQLSKKEEEMALGMIPKCAYGGYDS